MTCHGNQGGQPVVAGKVPQRMSHAFHASCTQCHIPAAGPGDRLQQDEFGLVVANSFEGRPSSGTGSRACPGAPPTIPHHTLMRENCYSCHRQSCTQCHAPSASKDQRQIDLESIRKPIKFPVDLNPAPLPAVEEEPIIEVDDPFEP